MGDEEIDIFNICHIKTINDARAELEVSLMLTEALFSDDSEEPSEDSIEFNAIINIIKSNIPKMPIFTVIQLAISLRLLIYNDDSGMDIFNLFNPEFKLEN